MTPTQYQKYQDMACEPNGTLSDDLNPAFIFSLTHNELLVKIASGEIDAKELAKRTLEGRGLDLNGQHVGFKKVNKSAAIARGASKAGRK